MHLSQSQVAPSIAVSDMARARGFYEGTLGLSVMMELPDGSVVYACGNGTALLVYPSGFAGTNQATYAGWMVEDFDGAMEELRAKGVTFEEYDFPGLKTENGVAEYGEGYGKGSWFKDPDGNILSLSTMPPQE
jgi:catechol 2,3-dioxygenase-like lactoylglutathione lyase family enzyme